MTSSRVRHTLTSLIQAALLALAGTSGIGDNLPSAPPEGLVLTEQDNGKTIGAVVSQSIAILLRGNPSTGYNWSPVATSGDSVLSMGPETYTADPGGAVGGGGTYSFPFQAVKAGQTTLSFDYRQPWNPANPAQHFTVTFEVTPAVILPRLTIELAKTNIVITWPIAATEGYFLEGAASLEPPLWSALNVLPLPEGDHFKVTLAASGKTLFFRLRQ